MGILYGKYYAFLYKFYHLMRIFKHLSMRIRKVLLCVTNQSGNISNGETVPDSILKVPQKEKEASCTVTVLYSMVI